MSTRRSSERGDRRALDVINVLRQGGATHSQLAQACSVTRPTVTPILEGLAARGMIVEQSSVVDGGRPARVFTLAPHAGFAVGVDLLQRTMAISAISMSGSIIQSRVAQLKAQSGQERYREVEALITRFIEKLRPQWGPVHACVVSTTGVIDAQGTIVRSDLIPSWAGFPFGDALRRDLECPVRIENDINAAAMGEFVTRVSDGKLAADDDLLFVNCQLGIHTGLILKGQLHRGCSFNAGEITDVVDAPLVEESVARNQVGTQDSPQDRASLERAYAQWGERLAGIIGPLGVVVDPRTIVIAGLPANSTQVMAAIKRKLASLRPESAPDLRIEESPYGTACASIGAVAWALLDADRHLFGEGSSQLPTLHHLHSILSAQLNRRHTTLTTQHTSSSSAPLRVGVVGIGARAPLALGAENASVPAQIVAACEPHPQRRERVEKQLKRDPDSIAVCEAVDELIECDVDVAFVTSPDDTHADIACQLLKAGIDVYVEKPLAIHLDDATRILETAYETGSKLYVGHNMRHMNVVRTMRDLIRAGRIGEVKTIWCRHFVGTGGDFYFKDWHATREHGTGLLLQKAAHDIDVMHWLADSHTTDVVAMGDLMVYDKITDRGDHSNELMHDWYSLDNWPPMTQKGLNAVIDVEDVSMMLMRMESGVLASYEQCHFSPDYWRNYTVIGTEGRLENFGDGEGGHISLWNKRTIYNPDGDEQFPIIGDEKGHGDADKLIVDEFLRFVAHDAVTDTSPLGAWYAVAAGIQATSSLREGNEPRHIPELPEHLVAYFNHNQVK